MIVTFCGHGNLTYTQKTYKLLHDSIEKFIINGSDKFFLGGYGNFDIISANCIKDLKLKYPHIKSILVIPYINTNFDKHLYDYSEYPPIENVPKRFAIPHRNKWMIQQSDALISYIKYDWGGAYKTYQYAIKKNKIIINLADLI